jgi:hypothetical protein
MRALLFALLIGCSASTTTPPVETFDADEDTTLEEDTTTEPEDTGTVSDDTGSITDTGRPDTKPPACIPVGASTTCKSYSDCCSEGECISTPTKTPHCCWTRLQKVTCTTNEQCCDDWCTAGKCCVPPGKTCALNSMCCSNWCGRKIEEGADGGVKLSSMVCCVNAGSACAGNDDCCSRSCVSGKCVCLPAGAAVPAYGENLCCSGTSSAGEAGLGRRCN